MTEPAQGVVLVGGHSVRYGSAKDGILVGGETLLTRTRRVMSEALGREPLVVGSAALPDLRPSLGPLAGIETAFQGCAADRILVVACDMPGLDPRLVRLLAEHPSDADVVAPEVDDRLHPICARWHRRSAPAVSKALDDKRLSARRLAQQLELVTVGAEALAEAGVDPERSLWNVNRPADLERFLEEG